MYSHSTHPQPPLDLATWCPLTYGYFGNWWAFTGNMWPWPLTRTLNPSSVVNLQHTHVPNFSKIGLSAAEIILRSIRGFACMHFINPRLIDWLNKTMLLTGYTKFCQDASTQLVNMQLSYWWFNYHGLVYWEGNLVPPISQSWERDIYQIWGADRWIIGAL